MNNKYDNEFYKDIKYSVSIILNYIKPESTILEFGPGNGELTKYLKEEYNCSMYTVEIDEELHKISKQYAVDSICCDADGLQWASKFKDIKFDYVIFADVLEHLRNPQRVLSNAAALLNQTGSVLFSIPNIAHSDIILNLINNDFTYTEEGLLDKTHIHFFTYNSIIDMFNNTGLKNIEIDKVVKQTGFTEVNIPVDLMPKEIVEAVIHKEYSDVYQFVGRAGIADTLSVAKITGRKITESYNAVIYFNDKSQLVSEIQFDEFSKQLSTNIIIHKQESMEFDVALFPGMVSINIEEVLFNAGEINIEAVNACHINGRDVFYNEAKYHIKLTVTKNIDHLNITIKWNKNNISYDEMKSVSWVSKNYFNEEINRIKIFYEEKLADLFDNYQSKDAQIISRDEEINKLNNALRKNDAQIISRDDEINKLNNALREKDAEIISRDYEINKLNNALREKDAEIISRDDEINKLNNALREKDAEIISRDEEINKLNYAFRELNAGITARDEQVKQYMSKCEAYAESINGYTARINELENTNAALLQEVEKYRKSIFSKFIR